MDWQQEYLALYEQVNKAKAALVQNGGWYRLQVGESIGLSAFRKSDILRMTEQLRERLAQS